MISGEIIFLIRVFFNPMLGLQGLRPCIQKSTHGKRAASDGSEPPTEAEAHAELRGQARHCVWPRGRSLYLHVDTLVQELPPAMRIPMTSIRILIDSYVFDGSDTVNRLEISPPN